MNTTIDTWLVRQLLFAILVGQVGQQLFALCAQCEAVADTKTS